MQDYKLSKSPTSKIITSPDMKSSISPKNVLKTLFSQSFLGNLKNELNNKNKSSKMIETIDANKNCEISKYKLQMELMARKLRELCKENEELKNKLKEFPTSNSLGDKESIRQNQQSAEESRKRLQICSKEVNQFIVSSIPHNINAQIKRLQGRIEQLELHRSVKQVRLGELLQKEGRYQSQIRFLMMKEENLKDQVNNLKFSIKIHLSDIDKPLQATNLSEKQQAKESFDKAFLFPNGQVVQKLTNLLGVSSTQKQQQDLLNSHCCNLDIPTNFHLSQIEVQKPEMIDQLNEVEDLIEENVPTITSSLDFDVPKQGRSSQPSQQVDVVNFNSSLIRIEVNDTDQKREQLIQSDIAINI